MNIKQVEFPESAYLKEETPKHQIYLHHTAGNPNGVNVFKYWASTGERVATCVTISGIGDGCTDGEIIQGYSSKFWAYHLGLKQDLFTKHKLPYRPLDKYSLGIEICNWGQLKLGDDGKFYSYVNRPVPKDQVIEVSFKGYKYFHNYTDKQLESVDQLLRLWSTKYGIPLKYNEDIWDISRRALAMEKGVFTHNSVRKDKIDVYPHPKLIQILKSY